METVGLNRASSSSDKDVEGGRENEAKLLKTTNAGEISVGGALSRTSLSRKTTVTTSLSLFCYGLSQLHPVAGNDANCLEKDKNYKW